MKIYIKIRLLYGENITYNKKRAPMSQNYELKGCLSDQQYNYLKDKLQVMTLIFMEALIQKKCFIHYLVLLFLALGEVLNIKMKKEMVILNFLQNIFM